MINISRNLITDNKNRNFKQELISFLAQNHIFVKNEKNEMVSKFPFVFINQ